MLFRRALLLAAIVVLVTAGPAYADHAYDHVLSTSPTTGVTPTTAVSPETTDVAPRVLGATFTNEGGTTGNSPSGGLARTGMSNIVPWIQAAIVLMGGGTLLVLAARRRRTRLA